MRLRFWRRPKPYMVTKPSGLMVGDHLRAGGVPRNATPPPGWTWDDELGWYKTVTHQEPVTYVFTPPDGVAR